MPDFHYGDKKLNDSDYTMGIVGIKKKENKDYTHFDFPVTQKEKEGFIQKIKSGELKHHRYLPFITFDIVYKKYNSKNGVKIKKRKISLPSHHDALVYSFFGMVLDDYYNKYVNRFKLDDVAVAYRKNKKVTNIDVARDIFNFISKTDTWVIKGDFQSFFDNLNHDYLLKTVKEIMGDEYGKEVEKMLKSVTSYKYISKKILKNRKKMYFKKHGHSYFENRRELGESIKSGDIKLILNKKCGIPQGTSVSATLANIYMIFFDEWLNQKVTKLGGLYRRYSDDFIIAIPQENLIEHDLFDFKDAVINKSENELKLIIKAEKTKLLRYDLENKNILRYSQNNESWGLSSLDYLGFIYDGKSVSLRSKSIYKFIYKSKRNINKLIMLEHDKDKSDIPIELLEKNYRLRKYDLNGVKRWREASGIERKRYSKRLKKEREVYTPQEYAKFHKKVTIQYLSPKVRIPRKSMLDYAKKAQHIFDKSCPAYNVVILKQVKRQIFKNQKKLGLSRKNDR